LTKESVNLQKNNFIDFLADKQSEIIFNNVQEKINALYSRSQKESYAELQNINDQLFDIGLELQKIETLQNTPQVEKTRKTLQEKQNYFLNKKTEYQNIVSIALLKFNKLYDTQIMQNRSVLQAENEVNLISNKIRSQEYNILNNIIQSQSNVEKVSQFKEWDSMLDLRTRKTHAEANGQIVNKNDLFVVYNPLNANPEYALEPMGEGLSIENTANCRCKARYSIDFILN
jgi:hypothetical protein